MTTYRLTRPHPQAPGFGHALPRLAGRALAALGRATRRLQYARMVSVLHHLSDEQLAAAGLSRAGIPEHARRLIYPAGESR